MPVGLLPFARLAGIPRPDDQQTADSVTPTGSPLDLLAGMAGGSLGSSLMGGAISPAVSTSPWGVEGASAENALAEKALADKPGLLSRWRNQGKYPLSPDESDLIDHHMQEARGPGAFKTIVGNEEGSLKIPFKELAKVTEGESPIEMSPVDWGKHMAALGKSMRNTAGEAVGAQLMDQTGTSDLAEMARRRMILEGADPAEIPELKFLNDPKTPFEGRFSPYAAPKGQIEVNTSLEDRAPYPQHPEAFVAGNMGHEVQHALDFLHDGELTGQPETLLHPRSDVPWTNDNLGYQGAFQQSRMEEMISHLRDTRNLRQLPIWAQDALDNGYSPSQVGRYMSQMPPGRSAAGDILRQAAGNGGFRGTDPLLADKFQTTGHFSNFNSELEIPPYYMGKEQAAQGGDIHPDWLSRFPDLKQAQDSYKGAIRPGQNFTPPPARTSPWAIAGAGTALGITGANPQPNEEDYQLPPHLKAMLDAVQAGR